MIDDPKIDLRKAALLLVSVPDGEASYLLDHLDAEQTELVTAAVSQIRSILQIEQDVLASELRRASESVRVEDTPKKRTETAVANALATLDAADPTIVTAVLRHELAQTIAIVLSRMDVETSATVLARLPTSQQIDVVLRMSETAWPDEVAVHSVMTDVADQVELRSRSPRLPGGGETHVAHILSCTDSATEQSLLANLAAEDAELVQRLVQRMELIRRRRQPTRLPSPLDEEDNLHKGRAA